MDDENFSQLDQIAWNMFSQTGNIGYYCLYSNVKKQKNNRKERKKQYGSYSKRTCIKGGRL